MVGVHAAPVAHPHWGDMVLEKGRAGRWLRERSSAAVILCITMLLSVSGVLSPLSLSLRDLWFKTFDRPATGEVVVVQIDTRSLAELDTWPWPRGRHADLLDRLREAGAEIVAFDVDFSSSSVQAEDEALARAIQRAAGKVVLASLVQPTGGPNPTLVETQPIAALRPEALIGNANILAERGLAREASLSVMAPDGQSRPTLAALVGQVRQDENWLFSIDHSVALESIPHLSYVDVLRGRFDPSVIAGKRIIIGATAVELGDRVSVPVHGVIAGVELQALIAESILQDRMLRDAGVAGQLLLALATLLVLRPWQMRWEHKSVALPCVLVLGGLAATSAGAFAVAGWHLDPLAAGVAMACSVALAGARELASRSRTVMRERSTSTLRQMMISLIVEDSSDGIVVVRDNGKIELCNDQAARLLGVTRKTLTGRTVSGFLPAFDALAVPEDVDANPMRNCDLKLEGPSGGFVVELSVRRTRVDGIERNEALGTTYLDIYTLRDVTTVRKARAAEERAQEEKLLAERAKSNFVANMSHELRTPLNAIIGFSEMLASEILGPVEQRAYVEHAEIVVRSSHHLLAVVNNVIDVARLDSDMLEVSHEVFALGDVVDSASDLVKVLTTFKDHQIRASIAPDVSHVISDQRLLKQVIYNLLSNAVKFSSEGSTVSCMAWRENENLVIEIEDQGCGIDATALPRLAELFGHAESAFTRPHDGLGVGLYLVKRCLEKLNGRLSFQTSRGEGTRVRVVVPDALVEGEDPALPALAAG